MITKTHYVTFKTCPRCYFYQLNNKEQAKAIDANAKKRIDDGYLINQKAYEYFSGVAQVKKDINSVNEKLQAEVTKKLLQSNTKCIAEASFINDDLYCAVDILVKNDNGYDIYEVKGSTNVEKNMKDYAPDVAFQKYVLQECGLKVNSCYILYLNNKYVKKGKIDVQKLLNKKCLDNDETFINECNDVKNTIALMRKLQQSKTLPNYGNCGDDCPFFDFCHRDLPKDNVLQLNHMNKAKAHDYINKNIKSFKDLIDNNVKLSAFQSIQVKNTLNEEVWVDKKEVTKFLNSLTYPLYHLDFETMNEAIPVIDGTSPYEQVPFQYSLHIENKAGEEPDHKEFLGTKLDCQYELAKQLCQDIPENKMVIAYNMSFEKSVLTRLAKRFPEFANHLLSIHEHMVDLKVPFSKGYYYNPKQNGSNSIKDVMPSICPEMEKAYKNLPTVHNGGQALAVFPKLFTMSQENYKKEYAGLLEYCKLDTYSMVAILKELRKLAK